MPVLSPVDIDPIYVRVVAAAAATRGALTGLPLVVHHRYREAAMEFHRAAFRRRVLEEIRHRGSNRTAMTAELGYERENTVGGWLRGPAEYNLAFEFAVEHWLHDDRDPYYSPFSEGVVEAARAAGYCGAVAGVREQLGGGVATLPPGDFWQLHHLYALRGWQGTSPTNAGAFPAQALALSVRAAGEYTDTVLSLERAAAGDTDRARTIDELVKLDAEWGQHYLFARLCLGLTASTAQVTDGATAVVLGTSESNQPGAAETEPCH